MTDPSHRDLRRHILHVAAAGFGPVTQEEENQMSELINFYFSSSGPRPWAEIRSLTQRQQGIEIMILAAFKPGTTGANTQKLKEARAVYAELKAEEGQEPPRLRAQPGQERRPRRPDVEGYEG